jgi:hypothetical protein
MPTLDPHRYNPLVVEATATSRVLLPLGSKAVVFYTTSATHELRVRAHGSDSIFTVLTDAKHAHGFIYNGVAHIYVATLAGTVKLVRYRFFGDPAPTVQDVEVGYRTIYLHAITQYDWFFLTFSDGGKLFLMAAKDPAFLQQPRRFRLYTNSLDPAHYVENPVLGIHPDDFRLKPAKTRMTVGVERLTLATGLREVGYFVFEIELD